ncbi:MAG: hypothetical protein ACPG42_12345 [Alphaproteobacteria bacterium]
MKNFLIAGSSLAAVAAAGSAGAVDVTLGGSIDMGVEYGVGKASSMSIGSAFNKVTLSIAAAGTTDAGLKYGGSFGLATAGELKFDYYDTNGTLAGGKHQTKITVKNYTNLQAAAYNVSGGMKLDADDIVAVKINSAWKSVSKNTRTIHVGKSQDISSSDICKIAGRALNGDNTSGLASKADAANEGMVGFARMNAADTKVADIAYHGAEQPKVLEPAAEKWPRPVTPQRWRAFFLGEGLVVQEEVGAGFGVFGTAFDHSDVEPGEETVLKWVFRAQTGEVKSQIAGILVDARARRFEDQHHKRLRRPSLTLRHPRRPILKGPSRTGGCKRQDG